MTFDRTRSLLNILFRVTIQAGFVFGALYSYLETDLLVTPTMFGLLVALSIAELSWYLRSKERNWVRFLQSVEYRDFNRMYKNQNASKELRLAYDLITRSMEELQSDKEAEFQLLQTVLRHVSIAVACYRDTGEVIFSNKAFNKLFGIRGLTHTDRLRTRYPKVWKVMTAQVSVPSEWIEHEDGQKLFVKTEVFKLKGAAHKLVSLADIRSPLDANELESYQKLMRVMTHEIMNSATPILSLIEVVNKKLIDDGKIRQLDGIEQNNISTSLRAIEERTSGMLKFVEAYRLINKPIKPNLQSVLVDEVFENVINLSQMPGIQLSKSTNIKQPIRIDKVLIAQVLLNLTKNAIEAIEGTTSPALTMRARQNEGAVEIVVEDNGPGISPKGLHQIFVPFFTTKKTGSGIGLALSRKIVKAHGGTLRYSRENDLTHFIVTLPKALVH